MTSLLLNARRFYQALKSLLALVGLAALTAYLVLPERPTMPLAAALPSFAPVAPAAAAVDLPMPVADAVLQREQEAVAEYIAKRYRIADDAAAHFVSVAYRAAEQHRLDALLEPEVNILVGAQILREYQRRFGDTETALQMYAGALDEPTSQYANKVFAEKARLDALRFKARRSGQSV